MPPKPDLWACAPSGLLQGFGRLKVPSPEVCFGSKLESPHSGPLRASPRVGPESAGHGVRKQASRPRQENARLWRRYMWNLAAAPVPLGVNLRLEGLQEASVVPNLSRW